MFLDCNFGYCLLPPLLLEEDLPLLDLPRLEADLALLELLDDDDLALELLELLLLELLYPELLELLLLELLYPELLELLPELLEVFPELLYPELLEPRYPDELRVLPLYVLPVRELLFVLGTALVLLLLLYDLLRCAASALTVLPVRELRVAVPVLDLFALFLPVITDLLERDLAVVDLPLNELLPLLVVALDLPLKEVAASVLLL